MLVALAVVALCYCGGKYCPKVLSSNKEVVLGVLVGMALCSFAGLRMEGFDVMTSDGATEFQSTCCNFVDGTIRNPDSLGMDPQCNENRDENRAIKEGLCSQASRNREYKGGGRSESPISGPPGNLLFKQDCCEPNSPPFSLEAGSDSDYCFQYAFDKSVTEFTEIRDLYNATSMYMNMCSS